MARFGPGVRKIKVDARDFSGGKDLGETGGVYADKTQVVDILICLKLKGHLSSVQSRYS